jgi:hypothetical protein
VRTETTATVYRRSVDPTTRGDVYARSVLPSVHWEDGRSARFGKAPSATQATIFIPASSLPTDGSVAGLSVGDIIVRGSVADELSALFTPTNLREKYSSALVVSSTDAVDYGSMAMRHWKVGAE